jgi:hypothetical protein
MRKAFTGLAIVLLLLVVAQFFFAASGAFSTASREEFFRPHHALGYVIFLLPVAMAIVGALARLPWRLIGMAALVAGLTTVQVVIGVLARAFGDPAEKTTAGPLIFGLHAVNALVILAVAGMVVRRALSPAAATARQAGADDSTGPASQETQPEPVQTGGGASAG